MSSNFWTLSWVISCSHDTVIILCVSGQWTWENSFYGNLWEWWMTTFNITNIVCNFPREPSEWYIFKSYTKHSCIVWLGNTDWEIYLLVTQSIQGAMILNPIEKFKFAILHQNRDCNHWNRLKEISCGNHIKYFMTYTPWYSWAGLIDKYININHWPYLNIWFVWKIGWNEVTKNDLHWKSRIS